MGLTDEQLEAVTRLGDNLCVVAGAGTGKTRVLVERFSRLLDEGGLDPDQVAAITFTEKAAAEMIDRVRRECETRIGAAPSAERRAFWQGRRTGLAACYIGTFHGFCGALIRQYPVEAEVDPRFTVLADNEQQLLRTRSVMETVRRLCAEDGPDIRLAAGAYGLRALTNILETVLRKRQQFDRAMASGDWDRPPAERLAGLTKLVRDWQEASLAGLSADESFIKAAGFLAAVAGKADDLMEISRQQAVAAVGMLKERPDSDGPLNGVRALSQIELRGGSAKQWASKELLGQVKEALKQLRETAKETLKNCAVSDASHWPGELELICGVTRVALAAVADYQAAKAERGTLDYDDLLLKARDLLRGHPAARRRLAARFRQILVDELQDTDELQIEILGLLLGESRSREFHPRPGSFFGVGDPKQSIYRFRGADVGVFRRIARSLGRSGTVSLTRTFRFHQGQADVTNTVFAHLLGEDFAALEAQEKSKPLVSCELLLAAPADNENQDLGDSDMIAREAALVATRIRNLVEHDRAAYGDIALLMHRQTQSYQYEDALRRAGIPFFVVSGRRFYEQQEVRDVVTALQVLRNPGDALALAALLRSPFFGLSDEALVALCHEGRFADLGSPEVQRQLSPDDAAKAARATAWLRHFANRAGRIGIAQLVAEIVFEGLPAAPGHSGEVSVAALAPALLPQFLGEQRYANLRRLIEIARECDRAGEARLEAFLARLQASIAEGLEEAEAPLSAEGRNAVVLMTVHKAKGLEFPYVFLINANATRRPQGEPFYLSPAFGLVPRRPDRTADAEEPAAYSILSRRDHELEIEEFRRLFYVGATRAQRRLFITGADEAKEGSWINLLAGALGIDLTRTAAGPFNVEPIGGSVVRVEATPSQPVQAAAATRSARLNALFQDGRLATDALAKLVANPAAGSTQELVRRVAEVPEDLSRFRLAATDLADYETCPARFYFKRVLRLPPIPGPTAGPPASGRSAAALGQVVHDYLQQVDFSAPQVDQKKLRRLIRLATDLPARSRDMALRDAAGMIERFIASDIGRELKQARNIVREASFLIDLQEVTVTGRLDLLYQERSGDWVLVDYKTDRITEAEVEKRAGDYKLQLAIYSSAVGKFLGTELKKSSLAFLNPGIIYTIKVSTACDALEAVLAGIRARRFNHLDECAGRCEYVRLCRSPKSNQG